MNEPRNPDPEFAKQSLGEFFVEQQAKDNAYKNGYTEGAVTERNRILQEVEKTIEKYRPHEDVIRSMSIDEEEDINNLLDDMKEELKQVIQKS